MGAAAIVTAVASLAGTYLQQQAAEDANKERRRAISLAEERKGKLDKERLDTINEFTQETFDPTKRLERFNQAANDSEASLVDYLLSANDGNYGEVEAAQGNVSEDYIRKRAESTASATEDVLKKAKLMGRNNAGGLMYNQESLDGANLASDLAAIGYEGNRVNRNLQNQLSGITNDGSLAGGFLQAASPVIGEKAGSLFKKKAA